MVKGSVIALRSKSSALDHLEEARMLSATAVSPHRHNYILFAGAISVLGWALSCSFSDTKGPDIARYFWPAEKGLTLHFEYLEVGESGERRQQLTHEVTIIDVQQPTADNDEMVVLTTETFESRGQNRQIQFRYTISSSNDYIRRQALDGEDERTILRGPIEVGTTWDVPYMQWSLTLMPSWENLGSQLEGPISYRTTTCRIAEMSERTELSARRSCLKVECPVPRIADNAKGAPEVMFTDHYYHCDGIGYTGTYVRQSSGEGFWLERLISIISASSKPEEKPRF